MMGAVFLPAIVCLPGFVFRRNHVLCLTQIPGGDLADEQIAQYLRTHPLRLRITTGKTMTAVAILAIYLGIVSELASRARSQAFESLAKSHGHDHWKYLDAEQVHLQLAADTEAVGLDGSADRQAARWAAALAEYHAAMKRKYEEAAARRSLSVEPDPPKPRLP
jgi:hypothetical protein